MWEIIVKTRPIEIILGISENLKDFMKHNLPWSFEPTTSFLETATMNRNGTFVFEMTF